jgi:LEA14-like dessication related protein
MRCLLLLIAAAVGVGAAAGCSKPAPPTLKPESVTINGVDPSGLALTVTISATNPNSSDLTVSDVSSHVVVDKHDIGTVTVPESLTLPAGKTTKIDVPLKMTWSDLSLLAQLAVGNAPVPYSVDGTLDLGGSLLHVGVPFHLDGAIPHQQIVGAISHSMPMLPR